VEDPTILVRKREGHLWVNFEGGHTSTMLIEKGGDSGVVLVEFR
jgi:hypothetical protein